MFIEQPCLPWLLKRGKLPTNLFWFWMCFFGPAKLQCSCSHKYSSKKCWCVDLMSRCSEMLLCSYIRWSDKKNKNISIFECKTILCSKKYSLLRFSQVLVWQNFYIYPKLTMLQSFNVSKKILPIPLLLPETSFIKKIFYGSIYFREGTIMEKFT